MEQAVNEIFSIIEEEAKNGKNNEPNSILEQGVKNIKFRLNKNGEYTHSISRPGFGVVVVTKSTILSPDATFDITVKSSGGGGGHWTNIQTGQAFDCTVKTVRDIMKYTKVIIHIKSNATNIKGKAKIEYTLKNKD